MISIKDESFHVLAIDVFETLLLAELNGFGC